MGISAAKRNRSDTTGVYLEIGDRTAGDVVTYPDDDVQIVQVPDGRLQAVRMGASPFDLRHPWRRLITSPGATSKFLLRRQFRYHAYRTSRGRQTRGRESAPHRREKPSL